MEYGRDDGGHQQRWLVGYLCGQCRQYDARGPS